MTTAEAPVLIDEIAEQESTHAAGAPAAEQAIGRIVPQGKEPVVEFQTFDSETVRAVCSLKGRISDGVTVSMAVATEPQRQVGALAPQSQITAQPRRQTWNLERPRRWNITQPRWWRIWRPRTWTVRRFEWRAARLPVGIEREVL